jgi:hypothetical protein
MTAQITVFRPILGTKDPHWNAEGAHYHDTGIVWLECFLLPRLGGAHHESFSFLR